MKKFWPFSFFFLFFAAIAAFSPYLVIYFQDLGFTGPQIGFLTGISPLITLVAVPIWTRTADKTNRHRLIMGVSLLAGAAALMIFPLMVSFYAVLLLILINSIFMAPVMSLANSASMYMLGDEKDMFGRVRIGGTIGFGIAALITGMLVDDVGLKIAFWMAAGFLFIGFLVSLQLVYGQEDKSQEEEEAGSILDLLRNPNWIFFLIIAFIGGVAFAVNNNYFFPYMSEMGIESSYMGLVLAVGTVAEIPILYLANRFIKRFNAYGTMILSLALTGLRLLLFGLTGSLFAVMVIQLFNGATLPLLMVAGVSYADELSPEGLRTTGQGLLNATMLGIGTAVGGFLGGILLIKLGGQALYLVTGLAVLIVLALVLILRNRLLVAGKQVSE